MTKRLLICAFALIVLAGLSLAAGKATEGSWTGWVTDTKCGAKGTNAEHAACAKKCVGEGTEKYALYTPADKKIYVLDPQDQAAAHVGHQVTVKGAVEGNTIKISSIEPVKEKEKSGKPKSY